MHWHLHKASLLQRNLGFKWLHWIKHLISSIVRTVRARIKQTLVLTVLDVSPFLHQLYVLNVIRRESTDTLASRRSSLVSPSLVVTLSFFTFNCGHLHSHSFAPWFMCPLLLCRSLHTHVPQRQVDTGWPLWWNYRSLAQNNRSNVYREN